MASKLEAARLATAEGTAVLIANGTEPRVLDRALDGDDVGTLITGSETARRALAPHRRVGAPPRRAGGERRRAAGAGRAQGVAAAHRRPGRRGRLRPGRRRRDPRRQRARARARPGELRRRRLPQAGRPPQRRDRGHSSGGAATMPWSRATTWSWGQYERARISAFTRGARRWAPRPRARRCGTPRRRRGGGAARSGRGAGARGRAGGRLRRQRPRRREGARRRGQGGRRGVRRWSSGWGSTRRSWWPCPRACGSWPRCPTWSAR